MAAPHNHHSLASGAFVGHPGTATLASIPTRSRVLGGASDRGFASSSPAYCPALDFNPPLPGPVMTFEQRRSGAKAWRSEKVRIRSVK